MLKEYEMSRVWILGGLWLLMSASASAASLDISFNKDVARLAGAFNLNQDLQLDGFLLHNQDRGDVIGVGLHQVGFASSGRQPVEAGLGGKVIFTDADNAFGGGSGSALALGGFGRWTIPDVNRLAIGGEVYLAPGVMSFSGQDGYIEASAYVSYDVLKNAWVYLGYRYVKAKYDDRRDVEFDDQFNIGFRLNF